MKTITTHISPDVYRHEAFFFDSDHTFVEGCISFIEGAIAMRQPIMVAVTFPHRTLLEAALGDDKALVDFVDMERVGRNPARIIPVWREFVNKHTGGGTIVRGIGEPIWASRSVDELLECQLHEQLLNVAFESLPAWWLLCPYDTRNLAPDVVKEAERSHPYLMTDHTHSHSNEYEAGVQSHVLHPPLPVPPLHFDTISFRDADIKLLRNLIDKHNACTPLEKQHKDELVLAVNELVMNAVHHGGGKGQLNIWETDNTVVCEIQSEGIIEEPMVGRNVPEPHHETGRGLWIVNQLCDLVQIRSTATGTTVRIHKVIS